MGNFVEEHNVVNVQENAKNNKGMHVVLLQKVYMVQKVYVKIGFTFKMNNLHPV